MADGMFDSNSGGSSGSSYNDFSTNHYGRRSPLKPAETLAVLALFVAILLAFVYVQEQRQAEERELDRTTHAITSKRNFDRWQRMREYAVAENTLWFEAGSSHRDGDYHCKGGQFVEVGSGANITFCCSVVAGDNPPCLAIDP